MKLAEFRDVFNQSLTDLYPKTEIDAFFFRLIEFQLQMNITDIFTKPDFKISEKEISKMKLVLERLKKYEPIQYILGETEFYDLKISLSEHTLIPRPETEDLVRWMQELIPNDKVSILDIGTGSGCIAISLKKHFENSEVTAIDFSEKTLEVAEKNAYLNKVSINFQQKDILKTDFLAQKYDIIVSNPPYVRELEKKEMQENVLKFEPHSALFVSNEKPLIFYDKIADLAITHLNPNGILFFEINQYLGDEMIELLEQKGFKNIELKRDLFGNARMICGTINF